MKKLITIALLASGLLGGELSNELKQVAKEGIEMAGYRCSKVDSAYKKWDDSIKVICDDWSAMFIIKKYGGNWTVQVEK